MTIAATEDDIAGSVTAKRFASSKHPHLISAF